MPARPSLLAAWRRPYWVGKTSWKRYVLGRTGHLGLEQARWKSGPRRSPKDFVGSSVWVPNDLRCELPAPAIQTFHGLPVRDRSVKTDETSALRDFLYGLSRNRPRSLTNPRPVGVTSWSPLLIFKTPSHPFPGAFKPSGPTQAKPAGTEMEALLRSVRVPHAGAVAGHRPGGFGFLPGYHLPSCPNSCRT